MGKSLPEGIGIDTLRLYCRDWAISKDSPVEVRPSNFIAGTGELKNDFQLWPGQRGALAFANRPLFNLTVKPFGGETRAFVEFSVPRVASGGSNNFAPVGAVGTGAAIALVEKELADIGFTTNLNSAQLSRVDVFRNVSANEDFHQYGQIFSMMNATRLHQRHYGTTFQWQNKQRALTVYDKRQELAARSKPVEGLPANPLRFEYRLLTGAKVKAALPAANAAELCGSGWDTVPGLYRQAWAAVAFGQSFADIEMVAGNQCRYEMQQFFKRFGARWVQSYLLAVGANQIHRTIGATAFAALVREVEGTTASTAATAAPLAPGAGWKAERVRLKAERLQLERAANSSKRKANRARRVVLEKARIMAMMKPNRKGITLGGLYRELQEKVLN